MYPTTVELLTQLNNPWKFHAYGNILFQCEIIIKFPFNFNNCIVLEASEVQCLNDDKVSKIESEGDAYKRVCDLCYSLNTRYNWNI